MPEPVFQSSITVHAWNASHDQLAICPNSNEVFIYDAKGSNPKSWKKIHTLSEHAMTVTGIDWNHKTNSIVTSSHDRNAYVWTLENNEWKPNLVILRIGRAATCVKWSPDGQKFAVGSGSKQIPVCHYEETQSMWVAKMIKKAGKSSILAVDWSPNNLFLITGGSDFKCRIFSAYVKGVDTDCKVDDAYSAFDSKAVSTFGTSLIEFDQSHGWIEACRFSPNGMKFAFCGHDSSVNFGEFTNGTVDVQSIMRRDLPCRAIAFLSETKAIGAGYDNVPIVYEFANGKWTETGPLDQGKSDKGPAKKASAFSNAKNMFQQQASRGGKKDDKAGLPFRHQNIISDINVTNGKEFTTSGIDGRVLFWDASKSY